MYVYTYNYKDTPRILCVAGPRGRRKSSSRHPALGPTRGDFFPGIPGKTIKIWDCSGNMGISWEIMDYNGLIIYIWI